MVVKIERPRYLKLAFLGNPPEFPRFVSKLRNSVKLLGGELNLARSGLHVLEYTDQSAIVKCTHDYRDLVEASIQILHFDNLWICVRKVSGTLKALSKSAVDVNEENVSE